MPKVFSEVFPSDIGLIEESPMLGKLSDQEKMIEHLEQEEHFSKLLTPDSFEPDSSSPPALNHFKTDLVSTNDPFDKSGDLPQNALLPRDTNKQKRTLSSLFNSILHIRLFKKLTILHTWKEERNYSVIK